MVGEKVRISLVGGPCGIYALLRGGKVVYVGQSLNVFARVATHNNTMRKALKLPSRQKRASHVTWGKTWTEVVVIFDEVWIWRCAEADLDREEFAMIQRYLPEQNERLNRPLRAVEERIANLPAVVALIRKAQEREGDDIRRRILG